MDQNNENDGDVDDIQRGVVSDAETASRKEDDPSESVSGEAIPGDDGGTTTTTTTTTTQQAQNNLAPNQNSSIDDAESQVSTAGPTNNHHPPTPGNMQHPSTATDDANMFPYPPPVGGWPIPPPPLPPGQQHPVILQFYEAQMREHAAAYASAAAAAAWAAAQIAVDMASATSSSSIPQSNSNVPRMLPNPPQMAFPPMPPMMSYGPQQPPYYEPMYNPEAPYYYNDDGSHYHNGGGGSVGSSEGDYGHRRRKRQARLPQFMPGQQQPLKQEHVSPPAASSPPPPPANQSSEKRGRRRRRFRNDGLSDTDPPQYNNNNPNHRRRVRKMALASSSSDGGSAPSMIKKKQRQPSDESLLGKTGVSALYEWCGKRRTTPTFALKNDEDDGKRLRLMVEDFEMTVSIEDMERGRGSGRTKSAAKQEAARRALLALLPGVVFDEASGILIKLPPALARSQQWSNQKTATAASLEDLAPNLAKRLAIGVDDDNDNPTRESGSSTAEASNSKDSKRQHKWPYVYPSTTSEEEDENAYYASRGASVCSALLHAMVQIDERIPEAPVYTYQVSTVPSSNSGRSNAQSKRKAGGPVVPPIVIHRGSFTCTATMRLQTERKDPKSPNFEILQAIGVGGTKREARHTASAKLLALLFPECDGMVQVKQAAEAAREEYAASKALKQQSKRFTHAFDSRSDRNGNDRKSPNLLFAMASSKSPAIPMEIEEHILRALGTDPSTTSQEVTDEDEDKNGVPATHESGLARQLSRQKQLDDKISAALQKLNERDEEGRCLPDELTVDDVGRTVLRRATQEDIHWIAKLLETDKLRHTSSSLGSAPSNLEDNMGNESESMALRLWSSSAIVLLLCRAIAPYEDPPLGCAALTLGFSMERGRLLRIVEIASKPHLPRERFIECLQSVASCMCCSLETGPAIESKFTTLHKNEIKEILNSHLLSMPSELKPPAKETSARPYQEPLVTSPLQSVQEESEGIEESDSCPDSWSEKRNGAKKEQGQPSKRSRVQ